jgi:hypothetical protein
LNRIIEEINENPESKSVALGKDDLNLILQAIDLLLLSYLKAEGMNDNFKEAYADLRHHWGLFLHRSLEELVKYEK